MTLLEAIPQRHSVRAYKEEALRPEAIAVLREKVEEVNRKAQLHVQLILDEPKAFKSPMARYGNFRGVSSYLVMAGKPGEVDGVSFEERVGYYGEMLVLTAMTMGVNSCWVGMTYGKVDGAYTLEKGEKISCVISLGYGVDNGHDHKRKSPEQVSNVGPDSPERFKGGVDAALLAPTAVNQQKFRFTYKPSADGSKAKVIADKTFAFSGYTLVDLGIVKFHFELAAGTENFDWE